MTEAAITAELAIVTTAIENLLKTGKRYEIISGSSRRVFEMEDLKDLRDLRYSLEQDLLNVQGTSGLVLGF